MSTETKEPRIRAKKPKKPFNANKPGKHSSHPLSDQERDIRISKALSYLLRHGAIKEKLNIDEYGYIGINEVLAHNRLKTYGATIEDIRRIVDDNDKQRFHIENEKICANQGHSIKVNEDGMELLTIENMPEEIYHGTYRKKLGLIINSGGLNKMTRNHIHFTSNCNDSVSGIRKSANILIYIDILKCLDDGIIFYKSKNNVILSPGNDQGYIDVKYFKKIIDLKTDNEIDIKTIHE